MSTETQNNALVSAELGAKVDAIVQIVQEMAQEKPTSVNAYGLSTWTKAKKLITDLVKSYSAPVAAQPDLTQQTLEDVMAGIPARDAEIEALRKEIEVLQAQLVDRSPEMQRKPVDESPNLQGQQQPVSGADGLDERAEFEKAWTSYPGRKTPIRFDDGEYQYPAANTAWKFWQARAALDQQDALQTEVLDMVRMLEANEWADHCGKSELGQRLEWAITALQNRISELTKSSSQQDADKVDADRYRWLRDKRTREELQIVLCDEGVELDAAIDAARKEHSNG